MPERSRDTILIVDDDAAIRQLLDHTLSGEGYACREAESAFQTMNELKRNNISLVILDIKMPGKSGVHLMPQIKARYAETVVIIATATIDIDTAINCMKLGLTTISPSPLTLTK